MTYQDKASWEFVHQKSLCVCVFACLCLCDSCNSCWQLLHSLVCCTDFGDSFGIYSECNFFETLYLLLRARLVCRTAASIRSQKVKSTVYFFDWCVYIFHKKAKFTWPFKNLIAKSDIYCIFVKMIRLYVHDCGADFPEITKFTLSFRNHIAKSEMHCIFLYSIFIYTRLDALIFWERVPAASSTMACRTMTKFLKSQRHCYVIYTVTVLFTFWECVPAASSTTDVPHNDQISQKSAP